MYLLNRDLIRSKGLGVVKHEMFDLMNAILNEEPIIRCILNRDDKTQGEAELVRLADTPVVN